jgi:hypothetical protein
MIMQWILTYVREYTEIFIIMSLAGNIILVFLLSINYTATSNLREKYKKLTKGASGKNIEAILVEHMQKADEMRDEFSQIHTKINILQNRMSFCIQKVGMIRYNAFEDMGSDLSYSIALLDHNNDGAIITGIHGRAESISYAKPIKEGKSTYSLSIEELQALERAKNKSLDGLEIKTLRSNRDAI